MLRARILGWRRYSAAPSPGPPQPGGTDTNDEGPFKEECGGDTVVPEPITMTLLGTGLVGMGGASLLRRRRKDEELV